ncbi:MAG: hypothetical protein JWO36_6573 [Myxococcales bacterium]|nr:hypothetical protein [Myxococcales bacterium]
MTRRPRCTQTGFTLIELMISLVIFSFVITGILSVAVTMTTGYREQRATVDMEGSVRVPMDFMADAIRQSCPGVPAIDKLQDAGTCVIGAISVTNSTTASDQLDVIYASGGVVTSSRTPYGVGTTSLVVTDASQLAVGDYMVLSDTTQGHLIKITGISGTTLTLAAQCATIALPAAGYPAGALVIRAQHAIFSVGAVDGIPTLMMDPDAGGPSIAEPLAEGVEDLQIAIGVDANGDNTITEVGAAAGDDEWQYNVSGDAAIAGTIRAVRITIVGRAVSALMGPATFIRPAAEDRAAAISNDGYRRRVLRTQVEIRNLVGSP